MNQSMEFEKFSSLTPSYNFERSIQPRYEKSTNGDVDYIFTVDVDGFSPSDIRINQHGNMLTIEAKQSKSGSKKGVHGNTEESEYKEFKKEISLPSNIDLKKDMRSVYTDNGLLEIRIPILPQTYSNLYPPIRRPITIQRQSPQQTTFNILTPQISSPVYSSSFSTSGMGHRTLNGSLSPFDCSSSSLRSSMRSPVLITDKSKNYVEEIVIDPIFRAEDLNVKTKGYRVIISAKHEESGPNGYSNMKEFNDEHDLPSNVDPDNLKATLIDNGIILIEAPYKSMAATKTPIMVHRE